MGKKKEPAERNAPLLDSFESGQFGDVKTIQSQKQTNRKFYSISQLSTELGGQRVWVRGRVDSVRAKGKLCFLVLRRGFSTVQALLYQNEKISKDMLKYASK